MCGILGELRFAGVVDADRLARQRDTMIHRGPDSDGLWVSENGRIALGHRRLAIIDLSPGGHQPMVHPRSGCVITFNGEIFNYRELRERLRACGHTFNSRSDTEVILAAYQEWGERCVEELHGQFAFAVADPERRRLFLARDRAGEKPLFYRHDGEAFRFASEAKALLADPGCPRTVRLDGLNEYFAFGYVTGADSIWKGIRKVLPGHSMSISYESGALTGEAYWRLPENADSDAAPSVDELTDRLHERLRMAVKGQLVADVPVGILLSGGVDSSIVAALAAESSGSRVRTFTARFEGHSGFDEGPYARLVADHIGAEHHELSTKPADAELLLALVRQFDDPIADSSMIPTYLVCREIRQHATVALGGDGGDELFGGYRRYPALISQERIRGFVPSALRGMLPHLAGLLPRQLPGRGVAAALAEEAGAGVRYAGVVFRADERPWLNPALAALSEVDLARPERLRATLAGKRGSILQRATRLDFGAYMVDDILVKVDRSSMLTSLEVRAPFLDTAVIEFAFRLPDGVRATRQERKILLRKLGSRVLPKQLDLRRKQGFSIPVDAWARNAWAPLIESARAAGGMLVGKAVLADWQQRVAAGESAGDRLFSLLFLALWEREYGVTNVVVS